MLHKMIVDGSTDMENLQELQYDDVVKACSSCNIATSGKSKVLYNNCCWVFLNAFELAPICVGK